VLASSSLVGRVARSSALFASGSALLAAAVTSALGAYLLQRAEDRRLSESAYVLASELAGEPPSAERLNAVVHDEHEETKHAGTRFAVLGVEAGFLAGDPYIGQPGAGHCETDAEDALRACAVPGGNGLTVVAASAHTPQTRLFQLAALLATLFSGVVTWLGSRPVARAAVSPLSRLRAHVAAIDVDAAMRADLGPAERVLEVDELRATISQLMARIGGALEQAQRFSANAAHELRTPLTALRAELALLAEQPALPEPVHEHLEALRTKVEELSRLVERLLILATPKRTREEPHEIVSLRDVMEDVAQSLPPQQRAKLTLSESDALVRGDAVLLSTLFANGFNNALKFGVRVHVRLTTSAREAVIDIDDDGPGVPGDARERVFEPFYREPEALRRRLPGHGLGLALVRHVAESHGGSARFADKPSPGARLQIRLPELDSG
jgi:two-component system, OmpR family, sensor histidine kinase MprB